MAKLQSILRYQKERQHSETLRRQYEQWRREQNPPLPERCDNQDCMFYTIPLIWNGKPFKPILDHRWGVNSDNRPEQLRFLCPNCDAQNAETRGGGNKGRVQKEKGGFAISRQGNKKLKDYTMPAEGGEYASNLQQVRLSKKPRSR